MQIIKSGWIGADLMWADVEINGYKGKINGDEHLIEALIEIGFTDNRIEKLSVHEYTRRLYDGK